MKKESNLVTWTLLIAVILLAFELLHIVVPANHEPDCVFGGLANLASSLVLFVLVVEKARKRTDTDKDKDKK